MNDTEYKPSPEASELARKLIPQNHPRIGTDFQLDVKFGYDDMDDATFDDLQVAVAYIVDQVRIADGIVPSEDVNLILRRKTAPTFQQYLAGDVLPK